MGSKALTNSELLAIVLGTGASSDAHEIAVQLVQQHGGLIGIAQLSLAQLEAPKGMGLAKATQLKSAFELGSRLRTELVGSKPLVKTPADAVQLLSPELGLLEQEEVHTLLLDTRNRVIASPMIYRGSLNSCNMRIAEVFRDAIRQNAAFIILAHNHPSGDPSPSAEDVLVTRELCKAGKLLDIELLDHLVIGQNKHVSLKERGLGFEA